jgi:type I restriction enzyme S subunit
VLRFRWETEFKETEIGEIPKDWEVKKLGDMATIKTGKTDVKDAVEDGEYPLFDRSDQIKRSNKYLFDTEAVIVPGEGKDFTPRYYKGKFDLHQRTYAIFDFKELNGKYLFFAMHILRHTLRDFAVGSTVESLRLPILENLNIPYPLPPEQSRIATVLSWFDDLIEVKKRQNEILEKTAIAIFKSWFIDFEPFRDGEFVYSEELGKEIPKGWEVSPIEKEFYLIKGRKYEVFDDYFEGCSPYLLIETFKTGKIEFWTIEKEPQVEENDVVLVADGESSGKVLRYQKGILGSTLLTLKPKRENSIELKHLIYLTLKFYEDEIMSHRTGSAIPHLDKDFLKSFLILLPPPHILQSFHSLVEPLFQKIILNQKQIMTLRKIRDTLLPLLVFGKLRVEEV